MFLYKYWIATTLRTYMHTYADEHCMCKQNIMCMHAAGRKKYVYMYKCIGTHRTCKCICQQRLTVPEFA